MYVAYIRKQYKKTIYDTSSGRYNFVVLQVLEIATQFTEINTHEVQNYHAKKIYCHNSRLERLSNLEI